MPSETAKLQLPAGAFDGEKASISVLRDAAGNSSSHRMPETPFAARNVINTPGVGSGSYSSPDSGAQP